MKKMAIFTEGRTELEFNAKIILEIASKRSVSLEAWKISGAKNVKRSCTLIRTETTCGSADMPTHFFMIYNCGNDKMVKTRMIDEYENLVRAGYTKIICHRDVAPDHSYADIPKLRLGLPYRVKTTPVPVTFVLSVMSVEAWFLAEYLHFERIDPGITIDAISTELGFDPSRDDMQLRPNPASDLDACYRLMGQMYDKWNTQPTIDALDLGNVLVNVVTKFSDLNTLCNEIDTFLE